MAGKLVLVLLAGVALGLAGCSESQSQNAKQNAADARKSVEQAAGNAADTFNRQKDALVAKGQKELDDLQKQIDDLNAQAKDSPEYQAAKADLEKAKAEAARELQILKEAGQDTWADTVKAYDAALAGLQKAYADARAKVKP